MTIFLANKMPATSIQPRTSELVLGVVCAVGTDYSQLTTAIVDHCKNFGYAVNEVRLSDFLKIPAVKTKHKVELHTTPEADRISSLMDAGNRVRELSSKQDILALFAASNIALQRPANHAPQKIVHVLLSLKRPEEVAVLRQIYGDGFFLVGLYSSRQTRLRFLHKHRNIPKVRAERLIERDQEEEGEFGQQTRSAFQLADVFVELDGGNLESFRSDVYRFLDLVFGDPFSTPTRSEHAMFLAYAASLRSADLSRQVGAVVVSAADEVISSGANDVPSPKGGLYWSDDKNDMRDHVLGKDSNKEQILKIANEIARKLFPTVTDPAKLAELEKRILSSRLDDLTEFGRPVHAEMEALLQCARSGVSPHNGQMFVTTFPCHNCAKHIIAAGIRAVYFVEPYPKSRALELHADAVVFESGPTVGKVSFKPFVGVAARRYFDLFSLKLGSGQPISRKVGLKKKPFKPRTATPRVPMLMTSIFEREKIATKIISETME